MKSITLNLDIKELYKLNEFIEGILQKQDFQIELIIEEIFANIVNYSNSDYIKVNADYETCIMNIKMVKII